MEKKWDYEKLDENGKIKHCPINDYDGKETGRIVFGVKAWFDENPEERVRRGWIKHIRHDAKDVEYNKATQYLVNYPRTIDAYTIEDEYHVINKSEEMMMFEEMLSLANSNIYDEDGVMIWI